MASIAAILALTNSTRVIEDLHMLRTFGAEIGGDGVSRPSLSAADMAARHWLATRMEAVGLLGVQLDGLGSVYGSAGVDNVPALLMGSHVDTKANASWLDGALGISYALEAARVLQQSGAADWAAWSLIAWQDATSSYGMHTAASAFVSAHGWTAGVKRSPELWRARRAAGVAGVPVMHASGRHGGWTGYLEALVDPGVRVARANATLGTLTAVAGRRGMQVSCAVRRPAPSERGSAWTMTTHDDGERSDAPRLAAMRIAVAIDDALALLCDAWAEGGCDATWHVSELSEMPSTAPATPQAMEAGDARGAEAVAASAAPPAGSRTATFTVSLHAAEATLLEKQTRLVERTVERSSSLASSRAPTAAAHQQPPASCELLPYRATTSGRSAADDAGTDARRAFETPTELDKGLMACLQDAAAAVVGEDVVEPVSSMASLDLAPMARAMPAAALLLPHTAAADGTRGGRTEGLIAAGAKAYVRAAVHMVLGECESEGGPACILGDARRNVRLADARWAEALDGEEAPPTGEHSPAGNSWAETRGDEGRADAAPAAAMPAGAVSQPEMVDGVDGVDLEEYPDL